MLYLGHFSFQTMLGRGKKRAPWHGSFTCLVEAPSVERVVPKLESLIERFAEKNDLLNGAGEIYLDSCVEVTTLPKAGLVAHISMKEGETPGEMYASLPGVGSKYASAYHLEAEGVEDDEEHHEVPFIELSKKPARKTAGKTAGGKKAAGAKKAAGTKKAVGTKKAAGTKKAVAPKADAAQSVQK